MAPPALIFCKLSREEGKREGGGGRGREGKREGREGGREGVYT